MREGEGERLCEGGRGREGVCGRERERLCEGGRGCVREGERV